MRRVKFIFSGLLLLMVLIISSELYQNYFRTFTAQFYYFDVSEKTNREELYAFLEESVRKQGIDVFAVSYTASSSRSAELNIYAAPESRDLLEETYDMIPGSHKSFFSGETRVVLHDFEGIVKFPNIERYYFTGSFAQIREIRNAVHERFGGSYIHQEGGDRMDWLIWALWGLAAAMLLMLTWMDIQFRKKETFLKVSMGASGKKLALINTIIDTVCFAGIFLLIHMILGHFISLEYAKKSSFLIFVSFLILNALLHLTELIYDYKEVLYGANISQKNMSHCYLLKSITMMVAIVSMSITMGLLSDNLRYFLMYDDIGQYQDYSFVSFQIDDSAVEEEEKEAVYAYTKAQIFYDCYRQGRVALSVTYATSADDIPYYMVNENTAGVRELLDREVQEDYNGYYILMPEGMKQPEKIAEGAHESLHNQLEGFHEESEYRIIYYDNFELLYFDTSERSDLPFGFEKVKNPVMICSSFSAEGISSEGAWCDVTEFSPADIMYNLKGINLSDWKERYNLVDITVTGVEERCSQYEASMLRIVLLNVVIFVCMLLVEILLIVVIVRMEYAVNAKQLAVYSILGYGIWSKNWQLLLLNLLSGFIAAAAMVTASIMFDISYYYLILAAWLLLEAVELLLIYYYIVKVERTSIPKILKGGSL